MDGKLVFEIRDSRLDDAENMVRCHAETWGYAFDKVLEKEYQGNDYKINIKFNSNKYKI